MSPEQRRGVPGTVETVKVKADNEYGCAYINKEDFVEGEHVLFDAPAAEEGEKKKGKK